MVITKIEEDDVDAEEEEEEEEMEEEESWLYRNAVEEDDEDEAEEEAVGGERSGEWRGPSAVAIFCQTTVTRARLLLKPNVARCRYVWREREIEKKRIRSLTDGVQRMQMDANADIFLSSNTTAD